MIEERKFPRYFILAVTAVFVLAALAVLVIRQAEKSRAVIPVLGQLQDFQLTAQDGSPFGLREMKGKINVVNFMFTSCRSTCPVMTANLQRLYKLYSGYDQVQLVSVTVDPETDSLSVLRDYAREHGVTDNRWVFLRGSMSDTRKILEKGFMISSDDLPGSHSTRFVLVDQMGRIRGYFDGLESASVNILNSRVRQLAGVAD